MLDIPRLEAEIKHRMETAQVPGLAIGVVHGGEPIYTQGFGVTSVEAGGIAVTPQTLFRIASFTKPLTGVMLNRLVERGVMTLDDPIQSYVPTLRFSDSVQGAQITLRHLLSHTAGLMPGGVQGTVRAEEGLAHNITQNLPTWPFIAPVGLLYAYSNLGVALAGYCAEVLTSKSFTELMQTELFEPLGMKYTTFDTLVAMTYPVALGHFRNAAGELEVLHTFLDNTANNPAGGAISCVADLVRFVTMLLQGGQLEGHSFLAPATLADMMRPHADFYMNAHWQQHYGLTFFLGEYKGIRLAWHGGSINNWWGGRLMIAPEAGIGYVILVNRLAEFRAHAEALGNLILEQLVPLATTDAPPALTEPNTRSWTSYEGVYQSPFEEELTIAIQDDSLCVIQDGAPTPLRCVRPHVYWNQQADLWLGFVAGPEGQGYALVNNAVYKRQ